MNTQDVDERMLNGGSRKGMGIIDHPSFYHHPRADNQFPKNPQELWSRLIGTGIEGRQKGRLFDIV